jgi:hypothetical protein
MTATPTTAFSTLTEREQALLLASFSHELTIVAREGYEPGTERLSDPELLRRINEIQHRIASAIMARLSNSNRRYSDAALISIIVGSGTDAFGKRLQSLFHRAWWIAFANELVDDLYQ